MLIFAMTVGIAEADAEAESAYYDDNVDMREFWLDAPVDPSMHAGAPPDGAPSSPGDPVPSPAGPPSVRFEAPPVPGCPQPPTQPPMPLGQHFILRARVHWPEGAQWMIFRGKAVDAVAASTVADYFDGALALEVADPAGVTIRFLVKPDGVIRAPSPGPSGRLPAGFIEELLHHAPQGCEELGIGVSATNVPEKVWHKLAAWHGLPVGGRAGPLSEARWRLLKEKVVDLVKWHPEGGVAPSPSFEAQATEADAKLRSHWRRLDRSSSPRPPSGSARRSSRSPSAEGGRAASSEAPASGDSHQGDEGGVMMACYLEEKARGSSDAAAVQSVAAGFGEEAQQVLAGLIRHARYLKQQTNEPEELARLDGHIGSWEVLQQVPSRPQTPEASPNSLQELLKLSPEHHRSQGPPAPTADSAPRLEAHPSLSPAVVLPAFPVGQRDAGPPATTAGLGPVVRPQAPNIRSLFCYDQHVSDLGLPPGLTTAPARYAAGAREDSGSADPFGLVQPGAALDANTA
ncbi:unnamed protein product, partial [Prorocentrum cordatum]